MSTDRHIPCDLDAEHALLGVVILRADLGDVADRLQEEDFYGNDNRRVYAAALELHHAGMPIDVGALQNAVGNDIIVSDYLDGMPRNAPIDSYVERISDRAAWRDMARLGQEIQGRALAAEGDPAALARTFAVDLGAIAPNGDDAELEAPAEGQYSWRSRGIAFEADYLRRERNQLVGELTVSVGGRVISAGDFNFSSSRTRSMHAKYLRERATKRIDFGDVLEEFSQRVLAAEREGTPAVILGDLPRPVPDEKLDVDGLSLLARHPMIQFGDGGAAKSYLALYIGGTLAKRGKRVGFFDWELAGEDHRDRLERLFGADMPEIHYARCTRPLVYEADRLRRIVRDARLDFCICDSIAFACDGPPEAAEVAGRYFQALRQLGEVGSLHVAHVTKSFESGDQKPFGSVFWHNGARATWNVKLAESSPDESRITIGLYNRKANLSAMRPAVGFEFRFEADRTRVRRVDLANVEDLAANLPVAERMKLLLRHGPLPVEQIATEINAPANTIYQTMRRKPEVFARVDRDGVEVVGLAERRHR